MPEDIQIIDLTLVLVEHPNTLTQMRRRIVGYNYGTFKQSTKASIVSTIENIIHCITVTLHQEM